jgi:hypothetical protein
MGTCAMCHHRTKVAVVNGTRVELGSGEWDQGKRAASAMQAVRCRVLRVCAEGAVVDTHTLPRPHMVKCPTSPLPARTCTPTVFLPASDDLTKSSSCEWKRGFRLPASCEPSRKRDACEGAVSGSVASGCRRHAKQEGVNKRRRMQMRVCVRMRVLSDADAARASACECVRPHALARAAPAARVWFAVCGAGLVVTAAGWW